MLVTVEGTQDGEPHAGDAQTRVAQQVLAGRSLRGTGRRRYDVVRGHDLDVNPFSGMIPVTAPGRREMFTSGHGGSPG
ncbi:hypothetical protein GCM10009809_30850 [Isoptericola hypogeus]|uniref:Uncharacterized protein n=1 Tax=Isoptericola hypogeus TaxID=300179 RepID=A0ABN2JNH0_9MICO